MIDLARIEAVLDDEAVATALARMAARLPVGVRPRQLCVRTLCVGMLLTQADHRPAHLTRVHKALLALPTFEQARLGVVAEWRRGPHALSYRQVERTFSLVTGCLAKKCPDGSPTEIFQRVLDTLVEASLPETRRGSSSLAVDWTDIESFSTRRTKPTGAYADDEAAWGHRKGGGPGEKDELFFGYYLSLATMVGDRADRASQSSCGG